MEVTTLQRLQGLQGAVPQGRRRGRWPVFERVDDKYNFDPIWRNNPYPHVTVAMSSTRGDSSPDNIGLRIVVK